MRNPAIALGAATLATVVFLGLVLFSQLSQVQGDIDALTASAGQTSVSDVLDDLRALDGRIDCSTTGSTRWRPGSTAWTPASPGCRPRP
jgi:hypothetical protein